MIASPELVRTELWVGSGDPPRLPKLLGRVRDPRDNGKLVGKDQSCVGMASMDIEE